MIPGLWALGAGSGEQTVAARVVAQYGATRYAWDGNVDRADASVDNETRTIDVVQGIFDVRSDHTPGVREIQLELRPEARTLGLTLDDLAQQTRAAIFGAEAVRNAITDVEGFLIRTPGGAEMPLSQVARLSSGISPPAIRRRDGERVVTVTGDVDAAVISAGEANTILTGELLAGLTAQNPDLTYLLGGEQQQVQSLDALYRGFALAMLMIFALLVIRGNLTPA